LKERKKKKFLQLLLFPFKPLGWLFEYEFYWWFKAMRKLEFKKNREYARARKICRIKCWTLLFLGYGLETALVFEIIPISEMKPIYPIVLLIICGISVLIGYIEWMFGHTDPSA